MSTGHLHLDGFKSLTSITNKKNHPVGWFFLVAEMEGFDLHFLPSREENYGVAAVETGGKQMSTGHLHLDGFKSLTSITNKKNHPVGWFFLLAEMEGFEPPHAFRRLADFESAPFSRLGTSPCRAIISHQQEKSSVLLLLFYQLDDLSHLFHYLIVISRSVGLQTPGAILDPLVRITEASSAPITQRIQRAVAEQAVEPIRIHAIMAREIFTLLVLRKFIMFHN